METNPEVRELEATLLPPASESDVSTTLDRPLKPSDERVVAAVVAQDVDGSFERFEDALRTVLSVPKKQVDKAVTREKKARAARRTEQPK